MTSRESNAGILASDSINSQYELLDSQFDLFSPENSPCTEFLGESARATNSELSHKEGFAPRGSSVADCKFALEFYLRAMLSNTSDPPSSQSAGRSSFVDGSNSLNTPDLVLGLGTPAESESYARVSIGAAYVLSSPTAATHALVDPLFSNSSAALDDLHLKYPLPVSVLLAVAFVVLAIATVGGNLLVILSVFTYKPLKSVQNFLIVSLAVADVSVGVLIMPLNAADTLWSPWPLGLFICNIWLIGDVFFCTSSIVNLSAIAIDRYYAIHEPLTYAQKRTATRMLVTIAIVFALSAAISVPQVLLRDRTEGVCGLSKDPAYVVASACGSFYVPCLILCFVYVKIYLAARNRLRKRRGPITATSVRATAGTQHGGSDGSNDSKENPTTKESHVSFKKRGISLTQYLTKKPSTASKKMRSESVCIAPKLPMHSSLKPCASTDAQCLPSPLLLSDCSSSVRERAVITFQLPSSCTSSALALERIAEAPSSCNGCDGNTQLDSAIGTGADASTLVVASSANHTPLPERSCARSVQDTQDVFHANAAASECSPNATPNGAAANGKLKVDSVSSERDAFANHQKQKETRNANGQYADTPDKTSGESAPKAQNGSLASSACGLSSKTCNCEFGVRLTVCHPPHAQMVGVAADPAKSLKSGGGSLAPAGTPSLARHAREREKISLQKERKAFRVLGVLMGFFLTCWVPFFIMYILGPFVPFFEQLANHHFWAVLITWLGYINSSLNPILYTIFNMDFRRGMKRLIGFRDDRSRCRRRTRS